MENKLSYKLQTVLVIIYLAVMPLLYKQNPQEFHNLKLITLYGTISGVVVITLLLGGDFRDRFRRAIKTYKWERRVMLIGFAFMFMSLFQNMLIMQSFVSSGYITTPVFFGAGPNYLSIFFYWGCMLLFLTLVPVWHYVKKDWIKYATVGSLIITGLLISYQVFINDFIGVARTYLFGFGNSNYAPDAFAIVGLALVLPFLFAKKIKWHELAIGAFFFFVVLLTLSRAAFMGVGVAVLFTLIYLATTKRLNVIRTLILVGITLVVLTSAILILNSIGDSGLFNDFNSLFRLLSGESDLAGISSLRIELWQATFAKMNSEPYIWFLGHGQSVYIWTTPETTYLVTNVHNMYLDILFSGGIFVFAGFIFLLVKQFIYGFRLAKDDVKNVVLLAAMVFIVVKWTNNSLNAIHSPFIMIVFIINTYRYMELKKVDEK